MAQTQKEIRFVVGTRAEYNGSTYQNDIYFCSDTKEIFVRGVAYGLSASDSELLGKLDGAITSMGWSGGVLSWANASGGKGTVTLFGSSTPKAAGTASAGSSVQAARADHVHPLQTTVSGNAGTATKLQTARRVDGVSFNGTADITHYAVCYTAAGTAAKTVSLTGFSLVTGARVAVKFTNGNTVNGPTLNVNSTGAKAITFQGYGLPGTQRPFTANDAYEFVYDGTNWVMIGPPSSIATEDTDGLMSKEDKAVLDSLNTPLFLNYSTLTELAANPSGTFNGRGFFSSAASMVTALVGAIKGMRPVLFTGLNSSQVEQFLASGIDTNANAGQLITRAEFITYESQSATTGRIFMQRSVYNNPRNLIRIEFNKSGAAPSAVKVYITAAES